jgi:hypothetical protein
MFMLVLITLFWAVYFPAVVTGSEEKQSPAPMVRVDRTDFPALYLSTPQLQGDAIWMVQARLRELGYDIEPDGIFDRATSDTVGMFQLAHNLTVDGNVNREVWTKLMDGPTDEPCLSETSAKTKVSIEIDVVKHSLTVFADGQQIKKFPVGGGKGSTPSPLGEWKITQKSLNWGDGFGTRWMGLNVPWGIYGIHGTNHPGSIGYSLSHGCIRMRNKDVEALYPLIPLGTPVRIVENGKIFPRSFTGQPLQLKASGQNVVYLQNQLKEKGIIFDSADGRFGKMTELAVKYYQSWNGLQPSGKADDATYRSLGMIK